MLDKGDDFYRARLSRHVLSAWYFHLIACFLVVTLFLYFIVVVVVVIIIIIGIYKMQDHLRVTNWYSHRSALKVLLNTSHSCQAA